MPVYEYVCKKGHEYERAESFSAPVEQKCIKCGAVAKRKISMPSVIFKGSGFYSTDNRGSGKRSDSSSSTESGDSGSASADSGSSENGHSHGAGSHAHDAKPSTPKVDASVD